VKGIQHLTALTMLNTLSIAECPKITRKEIFTYIPLHINCILDLRYDIEIDWNR
jgi:hypothetical protein